MDPLTAFSLACGVIQVVDFSTKIVVKCRQIYKDGASSEYNEIESMTRSLTDLTTDLRLPSTIQSPGSAPQLYHDDQELLKLAQQCSETATELINELKKLSIQGRHRKRDAFRKAVKGAWKHSAIEAIQKRLEHYRRTLDTRILINLRQHVLMNASEQRNGFRDLDRKIQNLIIGLSKDQNTFDELKDLIKADISQEFQRHREIIATEEYYTRILESLYFSDIHVREEGIDQAHKQTFEWIFDKPVNEVRPWDHFIDWLEKGCGTYWISGKAGSGKSTLMSFIYHDSRTDAALRTWSGTDEVFKPAFFFWSPGSQLQKSLAGLLRSLIYQIVGKFPGLMPVLAKSMGPSPHGFYQLPAWTEQRLRVTLQNLLSVGLEQYRLCIFIDGLDEFHGNYATLLDLISNLRRSTRVKFCLSSRPYRSFKDELGSSPMLRLQDLTELDIRRYVSDKLEPLKAPQITSSSFTIKDAIDTIVQKAEGVFLWGRLAVGDQLEGIRNGDDTEQLRERLEILPTEIEEVYVHMLHGVEKVYRKEVARYIRSMLNVGRWSIFTFALSEHRCIDDIVLFSPDISITDIRQHCKSVGERIATTCKGFLEVRERMDLGEWHKRVTAPSDLFSRIFAESLKDRDIPLKEREELIETNFLDACTTVEFLHRTAFDFFKDNEQGKEFLKVNNSANQHPQVLHVKALLAELVVFPLLANDDKVRHSISVIMLFASNAEDETGVAQAALMDLLDRSITMLCERSRDKPPDIHWCKLWRPNNYDRRDGISYPVDFLGLAAWFGLDMYVEHILGSQSGQPTADTADYLNYLLRCSVQGLDFSFGHFKQDPKLIQILLKRGADPNLEISNDTVWSWFLRKSHDWLRERDSVWWDSSTSKLSSVSRDKVWTDTVKAFLESGANVNEKICLVRGFPARKRTDSVNSPPIALTSYDIKLHLSARSVLQQVFFKSPNFYEIQDRLITSGASFYVECTHLLFGVSKGESFVTHYVNSKLSKQKLKPLTDICEEHFHANKEPWVQIFEMLDRKVVELFQELDIKQLYEQALQDEELGSGASQEEDPHEDQISTDTDRISDEPDIDAADSPTCEAEGPTHSLHPLQEES